MTTPNSPGDDETPDLAGQIRKRTRRGFAVGGAAALAGLGLWKWVVTRSVNGQLPWPLRRILELDEKAARAAFDPARRSRDYPANLARMPKLNGRYGVNPDLDQDRWRLKVEGPTGSKLLTIADVKALPRFVVTTELRCVEGWSEVVTWAGARLADLATSTGLASRSGRADDLVDYVSLATPDRGYYVGLDAPSAFHPQTLLCYEMNGEPLQKQRGAPLRLAIPLKYGIKSLKQIGTIQFTDARPADFWANKGYDWYAGF
jgi:DMSO/TMAO reductase YedYZ molybdopterin-dependent catalytic subunit